ncbi:MAG: mucoidy inhibitor MuiA family protein [Bacteroidota bacterium]
MKKLFLLTFLIPFLAFGNTVKPKPSKIKEVTVYLEGATIERTSSVNLVPGENRLLFNDLSPDIDENSIQISGLKDASILSLNFDVNYLEQKELSEEYKKLEQKLELLELQKNELKSTLEGFQGELDLLKLNQRINSDATDLSLEKVKEMSNYYRERTTRIKNSMYTLQLAEKEIGVEIANHKLELLKLGDNKEQKRGEITLMLNAKKAGNLVLSIRYNITAAGWFPMYDIKAKSVGAPIDFLYKANVYQQSGTDWKDVKVTLSTGDPNTDNIKPFLPTKYLNFAYGGYSRPVTTRSKSYKYNPSVRTVTGTIVDETGEPLPGANIIIKGTSVGTQSDFNGRYSISLPAGAKELYISYIGFLAEERPIYSSRMDFRMEADNAALDEVVVVGYGSRSRPKRAKGSAELEAKVADAKVTGTGATKSEGLTQMKFEIKEKYTINSNADITVIEIDKFHLKANFKHYVAPELNENVFLTATIKDWEKFDLLLGDAHIYFEDSYAGKTLIDLGATADSLNISLGMDPNIIVKRERLDNFKSSSFLGGNRIVDQGYRIEVKNNKNEAIDLVIEDRIPVSQNKEIKVQDIKTSDANYDDKTGLMRWEVPMEAKKVVKKEFSFTLKYPKNKRITL